MYLLFSDLHINKRPELGITEEGRDIFLNIGLSILDQIITFVENSSCRYVISLGDFFEKKDRIQAEVLEEVKKRLRILTNKAHFYHLMGNHDTATGEYAIIKLFEGDNFTVISEEKQIVIGKNTFHFIPFKRDYKLFRESFNSVIKKSGNVDFICIHQTLPGAKYDNGQVISGEPIDVPKHMKVFAGDLHSPQYIEATKLQYLGCPYQKTFGEPEKKFVWYLRNDGVIKPVPLSYPRFVTVSLEQAQSGFDNFDKGDVIRVTGKVDRSEANHLKRESIKNDLLRNGACGVAFHITLVNESTAIKEATDDYMIAEHVRKNSRHKNKEKLINIGMKYLE